MTRRTNKKQKKERDDLWRESEASRLTKAVPFKERARTLTLDVLESLLRLTIGLVDITVDRQNAYRIIHDINYFERADVSKWIYDLRRRGYLEYELTEGRESIRFTNKAKLAVLDKISERAEIDNRYRFVSFDIPEKKRDERDGFRRAIKQLGFKQIQQSLWVTNRNVGELVEMAAYEYGVGQFVVYIVAEKTDIDGIIEKMFS